jgi:hypothetical protein
MRFKGKNLIEMVSKSCKDRFLDRISLSLTSLDKVGKTFDRFYFFKKPLNLKLTGRGVFDRSTFPKMVRVREG